MFLDGLLVGMKHFPRMVWSLAAANLQPAGLNAVVLKAGDVDNDVRVPDGGHVSDLLQGKFPRVAVRARG